MLKSVIHNDSYFLNHIDHLWSILKKPNIILKTVKERKPSIFLLSLNVLHLRK